MTYQFKHGDRVVRIQGDYYGMQQGDTATVESRSGMSLVLKEYQGRHDSKNFVLAPPEVLTTTDQHAPGAKLDDGKLKPDLILEDMARALTEVIKVATFGANKYTEGGWLQVPNGQVRYRRAQMRHALARATGEECDSESNLPHLAHEAWNALARLELALREKAGK